MVYFADGSNLFWPRQRGRGLRLRRLVGRLDGYELRFHKSSTDRSGKCNILEVPEAGARVYGVLFEIANDEKCDLDRAEGLGRGYDSRDLRVGTDQGTRDAFAYVANPAYINDSLRPYHWYKEYRVAHRECTVGASGNSACRRARLASRRLQSNGRWPRWSPIRMIRPAGAGGERARLLGAEVRPMGRPAEGGLAEDYGTACDSWDR